MPKAGVNSPRRQPKIMHDSLIKQTVPGLDRVQADLHRVLMVMAEQVYTLPVPGEIEELLKYLGLHTGKLMRPGLVLLAGQCFGPLRPEHVHVGAIMEMIHGATLLHDDVVDESDTRRGRLTINGRWGNASAVLLGDFVLTHVLRMSVDLPAEVAREVADTAGRVCRGELMQTLGQDQGVLDEDRYLDIIKDKSASFFAGCCRSGAMLSGASSAQSEALAQYGQHMGMAFQIADDLIDICGSESLAGKPVGRDLASHYTLPVIHWLSMLSEDNRQQIEPLTPSELRDTLEQSGSVDYARNKCSQMTEKAIQSLSLLPETPARAALRDLAYYAGKRSS